MDINELIERLDAVISMSGRLIDEELEVGEFNDLVYLLAVGVREIKELYAKPANITGITESDGHGLASIIDKYDDGFLHATFVLQAALQLFKRLEESEELTNVVTVPCQKKPRQVSVIGQRLVRAWKKNKAYKALFAGSSWQRVNVSAEPGNMLDLSMENTQRLKRQLRTSLQEMHAEAEQVARIDGLIDDDADMEEELDEESDAERTYELRERYQKYMVQFDRRKAAIEVNDQVEKADAERRLREWEHLVDIPEWLRIDEVKIYRALLGLPFYLKHATNAWYRILNDGKLDSYAEIQRRDPSWVSPFSTNGNITALGNGGFVFFRVEVGDREMKDTRYGETQISYPISLIGHDGWVSLYDQLKPLNSDSMKYFYDEQNRLLRIARTEGRDNIYMNYYYGEASSRTVLVKHRKPVAKQKTRKVLAQRFAEDERFNDLARIQIPFSHFVFHGSHAPLGIALSVLNELRYLRRSGFRSTVLAEVSHLEGADLDEYLGKLVVKLFRPEAKLPVALRFFETKLPESISKPDGDERFTSGGAVNDDVMDYVNEEYRYMKVQKDLSCFRRQRKRSDKSSRKYAELTNKIDVLGIEREYLLTGKRFQDRKLWIVNDEGKGERFGKLIKLRKSRSKAPAVE